MDLDLDLDLGVVGLRYYYLGPFFDLFLRC